MIAELRLAIRNAFRNKLRAVLLIATTAIAFMIYGVLAGFLSAVNPSEDLASDGGLLVSNKIHLLEGVPAGYAARVARVPGVSAVTHASLFPGTYGESDASVVALMVEPDSFLAFGEEKMRISGAAKAAFRQARDSILVPRQIAEQFGWRPGDQVVLANKLTPGRDGPAWTFTVAGLYDGLQDWERQGTVFGRFDYFNDNRIGRRDRVHWIWLRTDSPSADARVATAIDREFANSPAETITQPASAVAGALIAQIGDFQLIVTLVVSASFLTLLIIVGNTQALAIRNRSKEFGILRTIGFSPARVTRLVVAEALLIAFAGGAIGLLLAGIMLHGIAQAMQIGGMRLVPARDVLLGGIGLMTVLGVATGALPAWRAARLSPTVAFARE